MMSWFGGNKKDREHSTVQKTVAEIAEDYIQKSQALVPASELTGDLAKDLVVCAENFAKSYFAELGDIKKIREEIGALSRKKERLVALDLGESQNVKDLDVEIARLTKISNEAKIWEDRLEIVRFFRETLEGKFLLISYRDFREIIDKYGYDLMTLSSYQGNLTDKDIEKVSTIKDSFNRSGISVIRNQCLNALIDPSDKTSELPKYRNPFIKEDNNHMYHLRLNILMSVRESTDYSPKIRPNRLVFCKSRYYAHDVVEALVDTEILPLKTLNDEFKTDLSKFRVSQFTFKYVSGSTLLVAKGGDSVPDLLFQFFTDGVVLYDSISDKTGSVFWMESSRVSGINKKYYSQ